MKRIFVILFLLFIAVPAYGANLTALYVAPTYPALIVGSKMQLEVSCTYDDGTIVSCKTNPNVHWNCSPATVATIDNNGLLTGVAPGAATLSATMQGQTSTTTVTVVSGTK